MKMYYISPRDVRKNRADPVHIMNSCTAFTRLGVDVTLVTPRVYRREYRVRKDDLWSLYGLEPNFNIVELPTFIVEDSVFGTTNFVRLQKLFWFVLFFTFLMIQTVMQRNPSVVIYSKCYISILPAIWMKRLFGLNWILVFEKPDFDVNNRSHRLICKNVDGLVATQIVADKVIEGYQILSEKIHVADLRFDLDTFDQYKISKDEARKILELPPQAYIVVYTGKIFPNSKEVEDIIQAAVTTTDKTFVLVGGTNQAINYFRQYLQERRIENVVLRGFQPLSVLYTYIQAADLLVSYYPNDVFHAYYAVPAKLTIYLCAERPIIVADLPALRSIFTDDLPFFVEPESPDKLSAAINYLAANEDEVGTRARKLRKYAEERSPERFFAGILEFINRL